MKRNNYRICRTRKQSTAANILQILAGCLSIIAGTLVPFNYGTGSVPIAVVVILCGMAIAVLPVIEK